MSAELSVESTAHHWTEKSSVLWGVIGLCVLFAASRAFIVDDAFISLRYAENFAQGFGLVFNQGEWTEGYTNFSWTLLLSVPFLIGLDPILFTLTLSLAFFTLSLALMHRITKSLFADGRVRLLCIVALGFGQTYSAYGTSGLETQMNAALTLWLISLAIAPSLNPRGCVTVSVAGALAVLTRPDSALIVGFWGLWILWTHRGEPDFKRRIVPLLVPGAFILGLWLAFKLNVYGELLPNTYYAKVGGSQDLSWGIDYILAFSLATGLLPLALLAPIWRPSDTGPGAEKRRANMRGLWAFGLFWSLYVISVGGDFMEYRFMVCVIPVFILVIVESLKQHVMAAFLIVGTLVGWSHAAPLSLTHRAGIEDIDMLASHLFIPVQDWEGVGKVLASDLPAGSDVLIATTAAGAIPFHSKLPTLDMLGLTDSQVAREGVLFEAQRNHTRIASMEIMVERGVHLMLGQPWLRRPHPQRNYRFASLRGFNVFKKLSRSQLPETARIVEIPLSPAGGGERVLVVLYLKPHPDVDALIKRGAWRVYSIL